MKGSKSHMTERRLKILRDAGFPFSVNEVRQKVKKEAAQQDRSNFDAKTWLEKYKDFLLYIATHGSLLSLHNKNPFLAEWVSKQRDRCPTLERTAVKDKDENTGDPELRESELMDTARLFLYCQNNKANVSLLRGKDVEPSSVSKEEPSSWDDQFGTIAAWFIKHGTYAVKGMPSKMKKFVSKQQEQHRLFASGLESELTSERVEKLEDICFPFEKPAPKEPRDEDNIATCARKGKARSWEEFRLDLAVNCIQKGNYDYSSFDDVELRRWAAEQKRQHKLYVAGKPTSLSNDQIQKLVDIKLIVKRPKQKSWPEICGDLMAFRIHFGTFDVSSAHVVPKGRTANPCPNNTALKNLQDWVIKLRERYCESTKTVSLDEELTQEQKAKLDCVGFPWTGPWMNTFGQPEIILCPPKEKEKTNSTPAEGNSSIAPIKSNLFGMTLEMQPIAHAPIT